MAIEIQAMTDVTELSVDVLRQSKGAKVSAGQTLWVWYEGRLMDDTVFDANFNFSTFNYPTPVPSSFQNEGEFLINGGPSSVFSFTVGTGQVIQGWDEAFSKGRRLGEVVELTIPAELAYGESESPLIPANSPLKFTVELLAALPEGGEVLSYPNLDDIGINLEKLGLNSAKLEGLNNIKVGLDSSDQLIGDNTNDLLIGGKGKDRLLGAAGADLLIGGKGKDRFIYTDALDSPNQKGARDIIAGFKKNDRINLRALGGEMQFLDDQPFSGNGGDVRFSGERLRVDLDGDRSADLEVVLPGVESLKASNLML